MSETGVRDSSHEPDLIVEDDGPARVLTINRPDRMNSLSQSLQQSLIRELLSADVDDDVRVVVLTAVGEKAFCAGIDLKELRADDHGFRGPMQQVGRSVWEVLSEVSKPTVAIVNGAAVGGGFELLLACDIIIAARGAKVGLPEAKRGMGALFGSIMLPRRVPWGVAMNMLFTGDLVDVDDLVHWGLVLQTAESDSLREVGMELARSIGKNAPISLRRIKETAAKSAGMPLSAGLRLNVGPDPYTSADRAEGMSAFFERREPRWTGK